MASDPAGLADLVAACRLPAELDRDGLMSAFTALTGLAADGVAADVAEDAFLITIGESRIELEMRPGGWTVNLSKSLANAALATATMIAVLWVADIDDIPLVVLPAVLPLVIDTERARLNRRDNELLFQLRGPAAAFTGRSVHPDVLYDNLPAAIQGELSRLDFQEFIEKLIENGIADDPGYGLVELRPADRPAWIRITFR